MLLAFSIRLVSAYAVRNMIGISSVFLISSDASIPVFFPFRTMSISIRSGLSSDAFLTASSALIACPATVKPMSSSAIFKSSAMIASSSTIIIFLFSINLSYIYFFYIGLDFDISLAFLLFFPLKNQSGTVSG